MEHRAVVIGIDGGGSMTRALVVTQSGQALAWIEAGGANPQHNADAEAQVRGAIQEALERAGRRPADVAGLVAGLAGLNDPEDQAWAERFTALEGLGCPRLHLNDAEVAHAGAFGAGPGIIAVAGTGSTIFALTDDGRRLNNDMFHHYAGAARHLSFSLMQRLACGMAGPEDAGFVAQVLEFWGAAGASELSELMLRQRSEDYQSIKRSYGALARLATSAAERGAPLAVGVCEDAARALALGVRLLGGCFRGPEVGVALIGGLARSRYISARVGALLSEPGPRRYTLVDPGLPPAAGAALLALRQIGAPVDEALVARLAESLTAHVSPAG